MREKPHVTLSVLERKQLTSIVENGSIFGMKNSTITPSLNRREALNVIGASVAFTAAMSQGSTAFGEEKKALDCSSSDKIDKGSQQMRMALQYVEASKKKGQECDACMQWIAPEKDKNCGGCKLFTGPVNPKGYCLSFAAAKK